MLPLWGMTLVKDVPYAIASVYIVVMLYEILTAPAKLTWKQFWKLGPVLLLAIVLRRNAIYTILMMLLFVIIRLRKNKKLLLRLVATILIPIAFYQVCISGFLYNQLGILKGGARGALSVPLQQTARFIRDNSQSITPEEESAILALFGSNIESLQDIAELYEPDRADNVIKRISSENTPKENMSNYFRAWLEMGLRDPGTYVQAFGSMVYGWFYVDSAIDVSYYKGMHYKLQYMFDLSSPEILAEAQAGLERFISALSDMPFTGWLVQFSYYTWFYLLFLIVMIVRKKRDGLVAVSYIWLHYPVYFLGPVAYMRYALPAVFVFPFVFVIAFMREKTPCNTLTTQDDTDGLEKPPTNKEDDSITKTPKTTEAE